ncbi:lamin tail domain-containing protein [Candidatus Saccharibacteria bacterium]|nr:lamin tail domain-containing protein [Candidatus Saccharibacteria bacterium]
MRKLYIIYTACLLCISGVIFFSRHVEAINKNIVISQIKPGKSTSSRLVELYNNADVPIEITDWCVYYSSPSEVKQTPALGCFLPSAPSDHIFIDSHGYILLASSQTKLPSDLVIDGGLGTGNSGHVFLVNNFDQEVDRVGFAALGYTASRPEAAQALLGDSKIIERKWDELTSTYIDTDNNEVDFLPSVTRNIYQYGQIYDVSDICLNLDGIQEAVPNGYTLDEAGNCMPPPVDVCSNLDGLQLDVPVGYGQDDSSNCRMDICLNLDGLQEALPESMYLNDAGECVYRDLCPNLADIQITLPTGYIEDSNENCIHDYRPLEISELLANPDGSDDGREFIEIYNPNANDVSLSDYMLFVGPAYAKAYDFEPDQVIKAGEYLAIYNDKVNFTLTNTGSAVRLHSDDGRYSETSYINAQDDMAWAMIDGAWLYSNRPTPGAANLISIADAQLDEIPASVSNLKPCAEGEERNPLTNRCRAISSVSGLVPCKAGQYRSEETNRCRNIVSDISMLIPCAEGEERNPVTNRCRSVAVLAASTLKPCPEGQERNPTTNRCRNIITSMPTAAYAPTQVVGQSSNIAMWSFISVGLVAILYGVWEWRQEIMQLVKKITLLRRQK